MIDNGFRKKDKCPYCGYEIERANFPGQDHRVPKVHELTLCFMCCELMEFGPDMNVRKFDIETIPILDKRINIKIQKLKMEQWWEHESTSSDRERRAVYVKED